VLSVLRIIDRYLIREVTLPLLLGLLLTTFLLVLPPILREAEVLVAKGVDWAVILRILFTLLPQALSLTIPMALLLGILIGFGRVSGDREFVALQACGISLLRLLRPVALVALVATAATAHQIIVALPDANQTFREITFNLVASRVEQNVKPRVFFEDFPNHVIYVRRLPPGGGWRDVLLTDTSRPDETIVYVAREGRILIDRARRLVQLQLQDGTSHTTTGSRPEAYESTTFERVAINLDPETVFRRPPPKGPPEKTFAELRATIDEAAAQGQPAVSERFLYQYKLALPATCPILALIGLALGASARKDGRLASFVLGFGVILVYYVLLYGARAVAMGGRLDPALAPWLPNIVMGAAAVVMMVRRSRSGDRPLHLRPSALLARVPRFSTKASPRTRPARTRRGSPVGDFLVPLPRILDRYVTREYLRVFVFGVGALLGIFYISTFIDLADKLFRGAATTAILLEYFVFQTPQFVYYVVPMAVLVATLVTIGTLTRNSELLVMRACGISLYRAALPLILLAAAASGVLYLMQEHVLATANRQADRLNRVMRGFPPQTTAMSRRWVVGQGGELYHFDLFDPALDRFSRLRLYHLDPDDWRVTAITYADEAVPAATPVDESPSWTVLRGWRRDLDATGDRGGSAPRYEPFTTRTLSFDAPDYFKSEAPDAELMNYTQLEAHIEKLRTSGSHVVPYIVALKRKMAFPFVTIVMTLLAVPFAVTTGRRGALYGVGVGIVLALSYWIALSLFGALGAGGVLSPTLAAWAPNILFGSAALYGNLAVRT
jgi:LPS export ABC transporter permease LptG/LPS export ABC transporter permease LptF